MRARMFHAGLLAAFALATGCGSSGDSGGTAAVTIAITPSSVQPVTAGGAAISFSATLTGSTAAITWTLTGPGSLSTTTGASTSYTPPAASAVATATTATITASGGGATANVTININPAPPGIAIDPSSATVTAGGATQIFTATLTNATGAITWTLTGPGSISATTGPSTTYTPPAAGAVSTSTSATLGAAAAGLTATVTITINPAPVSITVDPTTWTVAAGGPTKTFNATLVNAAGAITWALTGPGSISVTTGTSTVYTPPVAGSVTSSTNATLTATAGALSASATITVTPAATVTVAGTVMGANGLPADNCSVVIPGRPVAITDAAGKFTIGNVSVPYDLVVAETNVKNVVMYKGLTRTDPTVYFWGFNPGTRRTSLAVSGTLPNSHLVNPALPFPRAAPARVAFGSPQTAATVEASDASPAVYGFPSLSWYGGSTVEGTLNALQWDVDSDTLPVPAGWLYGSRSGVGVAAGAALPGQTVTMATIGDASVAGNVTVVPNMTILGKLVNVAFSAGGTVPIVAHVNPNAIFSYNTPALPAVAATFSVGGVGRLSTGELSITYATKLAADAKNVTLDLKDPPVLANPANNGPGIGYTDEFRWTKFPGGLQIVILTAGATDPWFAIFTMDASAHIPQLSTMSISGVDLPVLTTYTWYVLGVGPFASVDDAAGPGMWIPAGTIQFQGESLERTFITR